MLDVLLEIVVAFWAVLAEMAPYLLFGFLVAGVLSVVVRTETVEKHLGGRGPWPAVKAAGFGIPLPLCSCGVIPVGASLRRHGAGRGATVAFLIATPQDGVDSVLVTLSLLGWPFALFRTAVALVSGVVGGIVTDLVAGRKDEAPETIPAAGSQPRVEGGSKVGAALRYGFGVLPRDIGKAMLAGLVAAALITALVPEDFFGPALGGGVLAMLVMMAVGIPIYVCAVASVPLAAALVAKGVSPGAALAFLMTGPATNIATLTTIWRVMGTRTAVVYLASVAVTALVAGLALDQILTTTGTAAEPATGWMIPKPVQWVSAVALLAVLGVGTFRSLFGARGGSEKSEADADPSAAPRTDLRVTGMTCTHCKEAVERALGEVGGVASAAVDLPGGRATVRGEADPAELTRAVESLGYGAELEN